MQEIISKKNIGNRLKQLRDSRKLSQAEVSSALGLSRSHYSQVELGKQFPSYAVLSRVAEFYDKKYEWILHGKNPEEHSSEVNKQTKPGDIEPRSTTENDIPIDPGHSIPMVNSESLLLYLQNKDKSEFIESLPRISLPLTKSPNSIHRAFQVEGDHPEHLLFDQDVVVGELVKDKLRIVISRAYVLVMKDTVLIGKIVAYQDKGAFLCIFDSDLDKQEVFVDDITELWEIKLKITFKLNKAVNNQNTRNAGIEKTVAALTEELGKLRSGSIS